MIKSTVKSNIEILMFEDESERITVNEREELLLMLEQKLNEGLGFKIELSSGKVFSVYPRFHFREVM